jgi:uncharacterized repeat protein (TIGR01451 family)
VSPRAARAIEETVLFDSVTVVANPDGWTIQALDRTIDGSLSGSQPWPGIFSGPSDATGVVIDYGFAEPKFQVTLLRLYNQAGGILTDQDGIGTATVDVFDPDDNLLFSGALNAGNGGAPFDTVFPTPLDNVSRVRLSDITIQVARSNAPLWREFQAVQNVAFPELATEINADGFSDDVTISGTEGLEGTLDWTLFGPVGVGASGTCDDADWAGASVFDAGSVPVAGDGIVTTTPAAAPSTAGCYSYSDVLSSPYYGGDVVSDVGQPAETFQIEPEPDLAIEKAASPSDIESFDVGQVITYTFVATNTGNVALDNVTVNDTGFTGSGDLSPVDCPGGNGNVVLGVGEQVSCTASYTLTQADVDHGSVTNEASAAGVPPGGGTVVSPLTSARVPVAQEPQLTMTKTANPTVVSDEGEIVTYSFSMENTGNVTLTDVAPEEVDFTGSGTLSPIACPPEAISVSPGQQITCTATYEVTQADIDSGEISNVAVATGTDDEGQSVTSEAAPAIVEAPGPVPPATELPFTGSDERSLVWIALGLIATGAGLTIRANRTGTTDRYPFRRRPQ